ncbi:DNA methyltransferase [Alienimonas sp. DA493]|uniref:DNA methyltransferase n=1 Tax=Alienimonas sp. DA493 TaxID=3373605 RepID=UPI00375461EB
MQTATIEFGDALDFYDRWPAPVAIVSDGPYGLRSYPGDPATPAELPEAYEPHVAAWSRKATPLTTLWFWNSEIGWALSHPVLERHGWEYRSCHVWDKGIGHVAGNSNGNTLRKFPVTTEVCVQYVRRAEFETPEGLMSMKEWLRYEWRRAGLPLRLTNEACGVKNAATRKYFTQCHLWYYPPPEMFERFAAYANEHGDPAGRPYFSVDGERPLTAAEWERMRSKFNFEQGVTNVWRVPAVRNGERVRGRDGFAHMNQKPLSLMRRIIRASTDVGDAVWEPFGGLCSATVAARGLGRTGYAAELLPDYFSTAVSRIERAYADERSKLPFA